MFGFIRKKETNNRDMTYSRVGDETALPQQKPVSSRVNDEESSSDDDDIGGNYFDPPMELFQSQGLSSNFHLQKRRVSTADPHAVQNASMSDIYNQRMS
jgi:hypothetical protein